MSDIKLSPARALKFFCNEEVKTEGMCSLIQLCIKGISKKSTQSIQKILFRPSVFSSNTNFCNLSYREECDDSSPVIPIAPLKENCTSASIAEQLNHVQ